MEGECNDIVLCEFSLFPQERKMFSYLCRQWIIMSKGIISYMHIVFVDVCVYMCLYDSICIKVFLLYWIRRYVCS